MDHRGMELEKLGPEKLGPEKILRGRVQLLPKVKNKPLMVDGEVRRQQNKLVFTMDCDERS